MKRIVLFLATNLAVMLVLSVVLRLLGVDRYLTANGLDVGALLVFSLVVGFAGSIVSLLISKPMARFSTGAQVIASPRNADEAWLLATVRKLAQNAGIGPPDVAVYRGAPNAFATGAFRDSALVAVSSGLLDSMSREEVEAVLGHEVAHVANGDMVTLALLQGVVNTFVVFLARVVGSVVDRMLGRDDDRAGGVGPGYFVTVFVCEIVFGIG
ncbi:MAG TPA: protease HtpX, partial [Albitalea sp.]|nr:protease HtpX [Albitalea sp.]